MLRYRAVIYSRLPAQAMALYPFMIFKNKSLQTDERIIRHEQIHFYQQLELLIVFFYPVYFLNYLFNLARYCNHDKAYFQLSFEREAYQHEGDPNYLYTRKHFAWLKKL
jgi:hypothetical protein